MINFHFNSNIKLIVLVYQVAIQGCRSQYGYNYNYYDPSFNQYHEHNFHENGFGHESGNNFPLRSNPGDGTQQKDENVLVVPYPVPVLIFPIDNPAASTGSTKNQTTATNSTTTVTTKAATASQITTKVILKQKTTTPDITTEQPTQGITEQITQAPTHAPTTKAPTMNPTPVPIRTPKPTSEPHKLTDPKPISPAQITTEITSETPVTVEETTTELITLEAAEKTNEIDTEPTIVAEDATDPTLLPDLDNVEPETAPDQSNTAIGFKHGLLEYKVTPTSPYDPYDLIDFFEDDSLPALSYNYLNDYPTTCATKNYQKEVIHFRRTMSDQKLKEKSEKITDRKAKAKLANLRAKRRQMLNLKGNGRPIPITDLTRKSLLISNLRRRGPRQNGFPRIPRYGLVSIPDNVRENMRRQYMRANT